ncbi:hypothetical protein ACE2AJ_13400 [Aquihabitans daechungensis]|uniref:hypothetical protein n=1 Tax=Aquihabitans daechungensis TaxID=1052257 RepID=UPI003B9E7C7E
MPVPAEVSARPEAGERAPGTLRVRRPSPLPPRRRAVIAVVVAVLAVVGAVLVLQARSSDGDEVPQADWRALPVPRSAQVDPFDQTGPLGEVDGFGRWQTEGALHEASAGVLRSGDGAGVATIDVGSPDVLVHAQVVRMTPGSGLLVSSAAIGVPGLLLRATGPEGWELVWQRSGPAPEVLQTYTAPTGAVSVQVIRRGDRIKVAFDGQGYDVDAPPGSSELTHVGISSGGPGNELELFGYLPLDAG